MANIIVGAVVIVLIAFAIKKVIKSKGSCDCGCDACHGSCPTDHLHK
ncbi:FeoB-associated Cys-rich membrane protein [Peptoniphilus gorbachii]|uniref:Virus attachment protein p12 family protein n=2 Tax=Peptoniphilus gorbachii TaxID=411567 RepID=A0A6N3DDE2_9FIRM